MHIHFVGIGGIGMSALARLLGAQGHEVSGSDQNDSALLGELRDEGFGVFVGHSGFQVAKDVDVVVYSEAIPLDNPELKAARDRSIPMRTYFEYLGEVTTQKKAICVAGTHGKTTTTALTSLALLGGYLDPTVIVGAKIPDLENKNFRHGESEWMVVEACEYRRSFLHLQPHIAILTNIELDHLDYYEDLEDYLSAFKEFVAKIPEDGHLVANGDDTHVRTVAEAARCPVTYFSADSDRGNVLNLSVPGHHNLQNALAALSVGMVLGLAEEAVVQALNDYQGAWRRFEFKGHYQGADIYDDYAHHPTEVQATLQAARSKYPDHRIIAVFQPHQHSRTQRFLAEFGQAFTDADEVIVPNIYGVRDDEATQAAISVEDLIVEIQKQHPKVSGGAGLEAVVTDLKNRLTPTDLVMVMGAGDVWQVAEGLVDSIE